MGSRVGLLYFMEMHPPLLTRTWVASEVDGVNPPPRSGWVLGGF
jgi:hypothetical protein